jgi:hypothetical protein
VKIKPFIFIIFVALFLAGCATQTYVLPATVSIQTTASPSQIKSAIIQVYTGNGWRLERETDHLITFTVENNSAAAQFLYSSQYDSHVINRETVTIMNAPDSVSLSANQELVTNYGSAFERIQSINSPKAQGRLNQISTMLKK